MNKKIIAIAILTIIAVTSPVFATTPTHAMVPLVPGTHAPVVRAKWETSGTSLVDDDTTKPWTQITPPVSWNGTKSITYWTIVTDPAGWDDIATSYVDVYHPDRTLPDEGFKYQVGLTEIPVCYKDIDGNIKMDPTQRDIAFAAIDAADNAKLITYLAGNTKQSLKDKVEQCSAKVFKGSYDIDFCQMCGEFDWILECSGTPPCEGTWVASDLDEGYEVRAYAFDKKDAMSDYLVNYFEYMCQEGIQLDFDKLDFQTVGIGSDKMIEGDRVFDALFSPPNPACDPETGGNCRAPTVRNIGNIPVTIDVTQDDMDFGQTSGDWNVRWDARLGLEDPVMFWPEETAHLHYGEGEGAPLDLCALDKISFSIHVIKAKPNTDHSGFALIEPIPVETCWWM